MTDRPGRAPLQRAQSRLVKLHRQRVSRDGHAPPPPEFVAGECAPDLLGPAADGWQRLIETEYESVVIAGYMTAALARLGAPLDVIGGFGRIVEDEIRHVDLCAQLVETFGGTPTIPTAPPPPFPSALAQGPEAEFEIVGALVGFFCVFEELSGHVFRHAIDVAEAPRARWALAEIFRDEAFHGAFGFEAAKHFVPRWSDARRHALAMRVATDIDRFAARLGLTGAAGVAAELDPLRAWTVELERLGLVRGEALRDTFERAVERDVLPRLRDLGIELTATSSPITAET